MLQIWIRDFVIFYPLDPGNKKNIPEIATQLKRLCCIVSSGLGAWRCLAKMYQIGSPLYCFVFCQWLCSCLL